MENAKPFLSTLSLRRATTTVLHWYHISKISIHALLAESDPRKTMIVIIHSISIHALLAESDQLVGGVAGRVVISIHALLAESDETVNRNRELQGQISIHALLAESDCGLWSTRPTDTVFLSTLSLRRAT